MSYHRYRLQRLPILVWGHALHVFSSYLSGESDHACFINGTHHADNRAFFRSARLCRSTLRMEQGHKRTANLKARGPLKLRVCKGRPIEVSQHLSDAQKLSRQTATMPKTATCKWPFQGYTRTESSLRSHIPRCLLRPRCKGRKPLQHTTSHPGSLDEER